MRQKKFLIPVIFITLIIAGCGTPLAVKSLSSEQLKTLSEYQDTQKKYFDLIERYVTAHIQTTEILIKEETKSIINKLKQKAVLRLNDKNEDTAIVLDELITGIQTEMDSDQSSIKQLLQLLSDLKQKHREMKEAYSVILNAQAKLDEYIQLDKADEVLVNQALATIGIQKEKIATVFDNVGEIMDNIEKISK